MPACYLIQHLNAVVLFPVRVHKVCELPRGEFLLFGVHMLSVAVRDHFMFCFHIVLCIFVFSMNIVIHGPVSKYV